MNRVHSDAKGVSVPTEQAEPPAVGGPTPGPWVAYGQTFPHEILICTLRACSNYDSPVGESIAWTAKNPFDAGSPSHEAWRAKSLANARLMAEAPAMLEALRAIAAHDTGMRADFSVGAKQAGIARAAIVKVTGEAGQ